MNPNDYPTEIFNALYSDEYGDIVGLDEVMYSDPPIESRTAFLTSLLDHTDPYIAFQSAMVLSSWGKREGIDYLTILLQKFLAHPASIHESDFFYLSEYLDTIGTASRLYELSGGDSEATRNCYLLLLKLFPTYSFKGHFCDSLTNSHLTTTLFQELIDAHNKTYSEEHFFQASMLLPCIMKHFPETGEEIIAEQYAGQENVDAPEMEFVAESLYYSTSQKFDALLRELIESKNILTAEKAQKALNRLQ